MRRAVYAGTFDPITLGHLDIIQRATRIFDEVYVTIFENPQKQALFTIEERLEMIKEAVKDYDNVTVDSSRELAVVYAEKVNAVALIRGLRATQDYHYESLMAYANQYLNENIEIVFLMSKLNQTFISSSSVKEIASHHKSVANLVPSNVQKALIEKYGGIYE